MKHVKTAAMAVAILFAPAGGCVSPLRPSAAELRLGGARTLYVAEAAFRRASVSLEQALGAGRLKGQAAAEARVAYDQAHEALLAARTARAKGDTALEALSAAETIRSSGQVQALTLDGGPGDGRF